MSGYPYYVETFRDNRKAHVRAHLIPRDKQFDWGELNPAITALFYVHRAKNAHSAIAQVCEFAAGMDNQITIVTMQELNDAKQRSLSRSTVKRSTTSPNQPG